MLNVSAPCPFRSLAHSSVFSLKVAQPKPKLSRDRPRGHSKERGVPGEKKCRFSTAPGGIVAGPRLETGANETLPQFRTRPCPRRSGYAPGIGPTPWPPRTLAAHRRLHVALRTRNGCQPPRARSATGN